MILIAEESEAICEGLVTALQRAGHESVVVREGHEALVYCALENPSMLVVSDDLPGLTGWELARLLRHNAETEHLPILLLTQASWAPNKLVAAGLSGVLSKPIELAEVRSKVTFYLAPMPKDNQPVILTVDGAPHPTQVLRIETAAAGRSWEEDQQERIVLPAQPGIAADGDQSLSLVYDATEWTIVKRDAFVATSTATELVLYAGRKVTTQQRKRIFRKLVSVPVRYRLPNDFTRLAKTVVVSGKGVQLAGFSAKAEIDTQLELQLALTSSSLFSVKGTIRQVVPDVDAPGGESATVSIEFVEMPSDVQQQLIFSLFLLSATKALAKT
ncbi:MAG: response regulator [Cyanobacteria bacterium REEB65]|nr:response regulator [Cyanobacteria bacterium REEB65]